MSPHKITRDEHRRSEKKALKILRSPYVFNKFLGTMRKAGLVGEELNAIVIFIVVVSRIPRRPLNLFVKGHSSAGKNWLVTLVLWLVSKSAVVEITSASDKAWNYSDTAFQHRVVYVQERNEAAGTIDPIRLLISEGRLVRIVTTFENGQRITKKVVAEGPVAAISTTTKNRLEIDDETRHISIWVNESPEQTRNIVRSYPRKREHLSRKDRETWRMLHRLLEKKIGVKIVFPKWFDEIADRLFVDDLRVRRYYPAFVEACRVICLIRSFQPLRKRSKDGVLEVDFADFAITTLIFDPVFVESLHLASGRGEATRRLVDEIATQKRRPVRAKDLARTLGISMDQAYSKLRYAENAGVIKRANKPEKGNRKTYVAISPPRFVPEPEELFQALKDLGPEVRFVHPITGEWVVYRRH